MIFFVNDFRGVPWSISFCFFFPLGEGGVGWGGREEQSMGYQFLWWEDFCEGVHWVDVT